MFIDLEYKKKLETLITAHIGEVIVLNSNQIYYIEEEDGVYKLKLTKTEYNTHEVVWQMAGKLLDEISLLSNPKSDEKAFLLSCQMIIRQLTPTFPSKLRNKVNYQPVYGLEYVDKKIFSIMKSGNWVKEIVSFDEKEVKNNDNRLINLYTAYTTYIQILSYRLIQDYFEMKGMENHILAQINKHREKKIIVPDICFSY